jgi:hypothetical protein
VKLGETYDPLVVPCQNLAGTPRLGEIGLTWEEGTGSKFTLVKEYRVMRSDGDQNSFQQVTVLDDKQHSYTDKGLAPKTQHWYRVDTLGALDPAQPQVKKGLVQPIPAGQELQQGAVAGPFTTKPDTYVEVLDAHTKSVDPQGNVTDPGCTLKVWRHFPELHMWKYSEIAQYKVGDKLGAVQGFGSSKLDFTTDLSITDVKSKLMEKTQADGSVKKVTIAVVVLKDKDGNVAAEVSQEEPDPELPPIIKDPRKDDGGAAESATGPKPKPPTPPKRPK